MEIHYELKSIFLIQVFPEDGGTLENCFFSYLQILYSSVSYIICKLLIHIDQITEIYTVLLLHFISPTCYHWNFLKLNIHFVFKSTTDD